MHSLHQAGMVLDTLLQAAARQRSTAQPPPQILLNRGDTENAIERSKELIERIGDNNPNAIAQLCRNLRKNKQLRRTPQIDRRDKNNR